MKLYYSPLSMFSAKVRIALYEKSIAHDTQPLTWTPSTGWVKPEELPRLNPKSQIPVLIDGDTVIYDSTIILEYLDERFPRPALFPADLAQRARCRMLEDLGDTLIAPNLGVLVREVFNKPDPATRDQAAVAKAKGELARQYQRLDREIGTREFLCGEFTVADISCFSPMNIAALMEGTPPTECAKLNAWVERMRSRASVARYLQEFADALGQLRSSVQTAAHT